MCYKLAMQGARFGHSTQLVAALSHAHESAPHPMLPERVDRIPPGQEIATVTADGALDPRTCHDAIAARGAAAIIPPRKSAKPRKPDTPRRCRPHRNPVHIKAYRPDHLATMGRLSSRLGLVAHIGARDTFRETGRPDRRDELLPLSWICS